MKHLKRFETITQDEINKDLVYQVFRYDLVEDECLENMKDLIDNQNANIDYIDDDGETVLMVSAFRQRYKIMFYLINKNANWNKKSSNGNDFIKYLSIEDRRRIKTVFPEKYQEYLIKKEAEKYNL